MSEKSTKSLYEHESNQTLIQIFLKRVSCFKNKNALCYKKDGEFKGFYSWNEWADIVKKVAGGLYSLGIRRGDTVGILSENCPEWSFADLGILSVGALTVPLYPTLSKEDLSYIVRHANLKAIFVSNEELLNKISHLKSELVKDGIIQFTSSSELNEFNFSSLIELGRLSGLNNPDLFNQLVKEVLPETLATIIYTSGTTGPPKGVMLTHSNIVKNVISATTRIKLSEKDTALSFLPLSHVFERVAGYYFMMFYGVTLVYAENMTTVGEDILKVKPTVITGVPRFFEKIYARIYEQVSIAPSWKKHLFCWAINLGREWCRVHSSKKEASFGLKIRYKIAEILVFNKIKKALGSRLKFFISGGAALSKELGEFFYGSGVMILEGYGLTETSPVIAVNSKDDFRFGTVGKVLGDVDLKILSDGEIIVSGPCVMKGYYKNPELTEKSLKNEWFYTGDIGEFDQDGFLKITDRKKDIIVTSGGKNISPQNIESAILQDPFFQQVVVIGDKRPFLVALIVPSKEKIIKYAHTLGYSSFLYESLLTDPDITSWVDSKLKVLLKGFARYERIKQFALISAEFSIKSGELTPTLKVKRKIVSEKYRDLIDDLYLKAELAWKEKSST